MMLRPENRQQLLSALRPPEGYTLDRAVGTTFSLDLIALLTVPLAFTFFQLEEDGRAGDDPLVMLEALREYADRIAIFCQAGQIAIPAREQQRNLLFSYLEESVFEVVPPSRHGVFHPKLWALRYSPKEDGKQVPRYRLLCLSRNLTFDRSWDTMLVLDGELTDRVYAFGDQHPLGDFFAALPNLVVRKGPGGLPESVRQSVATVEHELRRVRFQLPRHVEEIAFVPLGLKRGEHWPFNVRKDRLLVVSPFLSAPFLQRVAESCPSTTLVSRLDTLSSLTAEELAPCDEVFVLDPLVETAMAEEAQEGQRDEEKTGAAVSEFGTSLSGLHAKLYIAEQGWNAQVWTGSANATSAAFHHNVEFLIRLTGKKSRLGIDRFLQTSEDSLSFRDMLEPYGLESHEVVAQDARQEALEKVLRQAQLALARAPLQAHVSAEEGSDTCTLRLSLREPWQVPTRSASSAKCRPITLDANRAVPLDLEGNLVARFELSVPALTSFFAFEMHLEEGGRVAQKRFVLNVPLQNPPAGRRENVLRRLLRNKSDVLRYLLLLLASDDASDEESVMNLDAAATLFLRTGAANTNPLDGITLFEPLVRTLARNPDQLERVARLVEDLRETGDGEELLPEGFLAIWNPLWQARQTMERKHTEDGS